MKSFKTNAVICLSAIVLNIGALAAVADSGSDDRLFGLPEGQRIREDVQVILKIPYEVVLRGEDAIMFLGIKNHSDTPLKLDGGGDREVQYIAQARTGPQGENLTNPKYIPEWGRLDENFFMLARDISKGESVVKWRRHMFSPGYDMVPPGTREIRVGLLTNPEEWAFSDWVPIRRLDDRWLNEEDVIYEYEYADHGFTLPVRQVEIEGDEYLFNSRYRFAKLPPGATPRFEFFIDDRKGPLLRTHFDGVDVPPQLTDVGVMRELEWTPEIAPHATILEELRAELEGEQEGSGKAVRQEEDSEGASSGAAPTPESSGEGWPEPPADEGEVDPDSEENPSPNQRVWLILVILVLAAAVTLILIRKRRHRK